MARGKYKLKRIRAAERRSQVEIELGKHGKAGEMLAAATLAKPAEALGVLRRIFHLARGSGLAPAERTALLSDLEQRIRQCGTELPAKYFGVKDARELAEVFLLELEAMNIRPKTFREFIAQMRIEGYQSRVRGKLFHLFVKNFEPLQRDFKRAAAAQAKELNNPELAGKVPVGAKPPKLLNAKGVEIAQPVGFGTPRKATQIRILKTD